MQIAHIFNEIKTDKNNLSLFFNKRCFDIDYIDEIIECVKKDSFCKDEKKCEDKNEEASLALTPIKDNQLFRNMMKKK